MKIISLNTWGGKIYHPLINFINKNAKDTDIFCFQEIFDTTSALTDVLGYRVNLFKEITKVLINYSGYFFPCIDNYLVGSFQKHFTDFNLSSGLAIFVKKSLKITSSGDFFVYRKKNDHKLGDFNTMPKNAQYISLSAAGKQFVICNIHGLWSTEGKYDTPSRIQQSQKVEKFLDDQKGGKILCGDLNLALNTRSLKILEENMTNLIKKYNIPTTRNKHFPGMEKFADYTFVSPDVKVIDFQVPDIEISDHLPMILEFS
ncbi:endonuclease/exonuclease/phosphatase family protein [Candidatus Daviesbacteria bacterium]|nr:endonuclease/exonuclease/phosphatase family protein [Candidatus Daviesbacteria bacterium]